MWKEVVMMKKLHNDRIIVLLLSLLVLSCTSTPVVEEKNIIATYCMVYDYDNRPVPGVEILIDGVARAKTDINGRCMIADLDPGTYEVCCTKLEYETVKKEFSLGDMGQVLYVKMYSSAQLLKEAEKELDQRHWQEARAWIDRVLAMHPHDPAACYLDAVLHFRMNDLTGAEDILFTLLKDDYREPYVFLFLADLEQYRLGDLKKAKIQLGEYLKLRYDPDVEQRLQALIKDIESMPMNGVVMPQSDTSVTQ